MKDRKYDQMISAGYFCCYYSSNGDIRWWRRAISAYRDRTARKACSAMIKLIAYMRKSVRTSGETQLNEIRATLEAALSILEE
mgnify:FL=1